MGPTWRVMVAVSFVACPLPPASDAGDDASVDAGSAAERHCARYAEAYCTRLIGCGAAEPGQRAGCELRAQSACDAIVGTRSRAGATRLEVGTTETCLETIANARCLFVDAMAYSSCLLAPGTRAPAGGPGAPCEYWQSCLEGICDSSGAGPCGLCSAAAPIGARCGLCDPRMAFCSASGVCEAFLVDGAACVRADQCLSLVCNLGQRCGATQRRQPCRHELECEPSDFCSNLVPNQVPGVCQPRTTTGAVCQYQRYDSAGGCALGSWCLDGRCAAPSAGGLTEGAQCSSHSQCAEDAVCAGLFGASEYGRCTTPSVGGPCLNEAQFCPAGSRCIDAPDGGSCRPLQGLDEPCTLEDTRWDDCRVGLACGAAGDGGFRCEALRSNGLRCVRDNQCLSVRCAQRLCAAPGGVGDSCSTAGHCASGSSCTFSFGGTSGQCLASCF